MQIIGGLKNGKAFHPARKLVGYRGQFERMAYQWIQLAALATNSGADGTDMEAGQDAMAILLGVLLLKILALGGIFFLMALQVIRQKKNAASAADELDMGVDLPHELEKPVVSPVPAVEERMNSLAFTPPRSWIAVHSTQPQDIETALGLKNLTRCQWDADYCSLADSERELFIAPPIDGWTLIFGAGLNRFGIDPSLAFHYFRELSQKLGTIQFFHANPAVMNHCWLHASGGDIQRAYCWNGQASWNQGPVTRGEKELHMRLYDYGCGPEPTSQHIYNSAQDHLTLNLDKIYMLAGFWSINPLTVDISHWEKQEGLRGSF